MSAQEAPVPFLDLVAPHRQLESQILEIVRTALGTAGFIGGRMVERFEEDFARFCETKYCVGVGSGTDALRFALIAAGVQGGDIVITVPNTFIATTEAISQAGAHPDFVDIDACTYNMDPRRLAEYLNGKCSFDNERGETIHKASGRTVRALVPVHLYGQMADMDPILDIARRYNLTVVEDSCQSHGAEYFSRKQNCWYKAGSMGRAAAFSFYPGKNLGACGEAGAVTTDNEGMARAIRMLRDHGQAKKYYHDIEGYNGRLDAIQAGILDVKLGYLREWNDRRREAAARYSQLLADTPGVTIPFEPATVKPVYHLYVVQVEERNAVIKHLAQHGIGTGIHYPVPLHLQRAYSTLNLQPGAFPVAERSAARIVSLPMFPQITAAQQERVTTQLLQAISLSTIHSGAA